MEWNKMEWNGMAWNEMESLNAGSWRAARAASPDLEGMQWNGMRCGAMEWNAMRRCDAMRCRRQISPRVAGKVDGVYNIRKALEIRKKNEALEPIKFLFEFYTPPTWWFGIFQVLSYNALRCVVVRRTGRASGRCVHTRRVQMTRRSFARRANCSVFG